MGEYEIILFFKKIWVTLGFNPVHDLKIYFKGDL